jgi:hypothetical protein
MISILKFQLIRFYELVVHLKRKTGWLHYGFFSWLIYLDMSWFHLHDAPHSLGEDWNPRTFGEQLCYEDSQSTKLPLTLLTRKVVLLIAN